MQTANDAIDPRSVREHLERLKSGVSRIAEAEMDLLRTKAGKLSALRRETQNHADAETLKLDARIHALAEDHQIRLALAARRKRGSGGGADSENDHGYREIRLRDSGAGGEPRRSHADGRGRGPRGKGPGKRRCYGSGRIQVTGVS